MLLARGGGCRQTDRCRELGGVARTWYSKYGALAGPGGFLKMSVPDLLNQNLRLNKIPQVTVV